jgi:hypothetical protein
MKPWNGPRSHHFASRQKKILDPLPLSRIMACTLLSLSYAPGTRWIWFGLYPSGFSCKRRLCHTSDNQIALAIFVSGILDSVLYEMKIFLSIVHNRSYNVSVHCSRLIVSGVYFAYFCQSKATRTHGFRSDEIIRVCLGPYQLCLMFIFVIFLPIKSYKNPWLQIGWDYTGMSRTISVVSDVYFCHIFTNQKLQEPMASDRMRLYGYV